MADSPTEIAPIDYIARWAEIVDRRRAQMESAYAAAGIVNTDYWGKRAKAYRQALHDHAREDPFFLRVRAAVTAESTVLDVGSGPGRHTLALAPQVRRVTAVEPSPAMLGFLREDVAANKIANVACVEAEWLAADVERADIVICSHVLYPIANVVPFVRKLEAHAGERVFVYLRADPLPTDFGLWSAFHGVPLQGQPVHTDLWNVLAQVGVFADVEIVEHQFSWTFATLEEAVPQVRNSLCLAEGDAAIDAKLRELLEVTLVRRSNGRLGPDVGSTRSAIISWRPRGQ